MNNFSTQGPTINRLDIFKQGKRQDEVKNFNIDSDLKTIIVSNSPSILKKEYGEIIDGFDIVIRMNKCVTKGYERYIGSKTDIWSSAKLYLNPFPDCKQVLSKFHPKHRSTPEQVDASGKAMFPWFHPENFENLKSIWYRTPRQQKQFRKNFPHFCRGPLKLKHIDNYHILWKTQEFANTFKEFLTDSSDSIGTWGRTGNGGKLKHSQADIDTGLLTILNSTLFFKNVTIYGFDFFKEADGSFSTWQNLNYYREKELEEDGTHMEDAAWKRAVTSEDYASEFINETSVIERRQIIDTLIKRGKLTILK